tara:strand:- start:245 stop:448 length:204 start_codon:yes stop_codon:yes gene_type:complete
MTSTSNNTCATTGYLANIFMHEEHIVPNMVQFPPPPPRREEEPKHLKPCNPIINRSRTIRRRYRRYS